MSINSFVRPSVRLSLTTGNGPKGILLYLFPKYEGRKKYDAVNGIDKMVNIIDNPKHSCITDHNLNSMKMKRNDYDHLMFSL